MLQGQSNQLSKSSPNTIAFGGPLVNFFTHNKANACGMNNALRFVWNRVWCLICRVAFQSVQHEKWAAKQALA